MSGLKGPIIRDMSIPNDKNASFNLEYDVEVCKNWSVQEEEQLPMSGKFLMVFLFSMSALLLSTTNVYQNSIPLEGLWLGISSIVFMILAGFIGNMLVEWKLRMLLWKKIFSLDDDDLGLIIRSLHEEKPRMRKYNPDKDNLIIEDYFEENDIEYLVLVFENTEENLRMVEVFFSPIFDYENLNNINKEVKVVECHSRIQDAPIKWESWDKLKPPVMECDESVEYAVEKAKDVSIEFKEELDEEIQRRYEALSSINSSESEYEFSELDAVCSNCNTDLTDEDYREDGENPQVGFQYWECPNCDELTSHRIIAED